MGNLEFNASEKDLRKSLDQAFKQIRVEKIAIPKVPGRSKYGFIEISWAHRAPVKTIDLCITRLLSSEKVPRFVGMDLQGTAG